MTIFFISDTHFNHANILNFKSREGKPVRDFDSVEEMDETMIDNWNKVVKDGDKVYHLGDVLFGHNKRQWLEKHIPRLKGQKRLVLGNHDDPKLLAPYFKKIMLWRIFSQDHLIFSHIPLRTDQFRTDHNTRGEKGMVNVHGHIHQQASPEGPYRNVCVEWTNYTPVALEELKCS